MIYKLLCSSLWLSLPQTEEDLFKSIVFLLRNTDADNKVPISIGVMDRRQLQFPS